MKKRKTQKPLYVYYSKRAMDSFPPPEGCPNCQTRKNTLIPCGVEEVEDVQIGDLSYRAVKAWKCTKCSYQHAQATMVQECQDQDTTEQSLSKAVSSELSKLWPTS